MKTINNPIILYIYTEGKYGWNEGEEIFILALSVRDFNQICNPYELKKISEREQKENLFFWLRKQYSDEYIIKAKVIKPLQNSWEWEF